MPWRKATLASVTMALSILMGDWLGHVEWGMLASVGAFTALYHHPDPPSRRAVKLLLVNVGLSVALGLGTVGAASPILMVTVLTLVSMAATFINGAFRVPPPGGYFFILAAALGTGLPVDVESAPFRCVLALAGGALAWLICMAGTWDEIRAELVERRGAMSRTVTGGRTSLRHRFVDAGKSGSPVLLMTLRMGICIMVATAVALALGNPRPYWIPLSAAAVLQGTTAVATLHRFIQRSLGTALGVLLGSTILSLNSSTVWMAVFIAVLLFFVELWIVRNYGVAAVLLTPIPLILAEAGTKSLSVHALVMARLLDTLIGCGVGLLAGLLLWHRVHSGRWSILVAKFIDVAKTLLQQLTHTDQMTRITTRTTAAQLQNQLAELHMTYEGTLGEFRMDPDRLASMWQDYTALRAVTEQVLTHLEADDTDVASSQAFAQLIRAELKLVVNRSPTDIER